MSIVPTAGVTAADQELMQLMAQSGAAGPFLSLSPTSLGGTTIYSNMAYMNNTAGLPYMLSQAAATGNPASAPLPNSNSAVALLNVSNLLSQKDSRWLQLEVCREFQRNKCSRSDTECKFAHPAANVEVQNGRVTACYDSIKGRCNRDKPACKYFHPPQHLKDQLLINGRNHLALKNALMQQMGYIGPPMIHTPVSTMGSPYASCSALPPLSVYSNSGMMPPNAYLPHGQMMHLLAPSADQTAAVVAAAAAAAAGQQVAAPPPSNAAAARQASMHAALLQQHALASQANVISQASYKNRSDKLEVCREYQRGACNRSETECRFAHPSDAVTVAEDGSVTVCMDHEKGRCTREPCRYFHRPEHLRSGLQAVTPTSSPGAVHSQSVTQAHQMQQQQQQQQQQQHMGHVQQGAPIQAIPNNVGPYKRAGVGMMDKSAGLPVYQPLNMTGSDGLGHHHALGANPATVQAHHPSVYHQAILQQLQQQQQQQQSFLPATYASAAPMTIQRFP